MDSKSLFIVAFHSMKGRLKTTILDHRICKHQVERMKILQDSSSFKKQIMAKILLITIGSPFNVAEMHSSQKQKFHFGRFLVGAFLQKKATIVKVFRQLFFDTTELAK